jgi:hypothetical protein
VTLQLHRPDGKGGLEPRPADEAPVDWRTQLRSTRWGASLTGGRLPRLGNPEMNPTSAARSVVFWGLLAGLTFVLLVVGYGTGFWSLGA